MSPYYFILAIVASGVFICFIDDAPYRRMAQKVYFTAILLILAVFAGFRAPGVDHDFGNYELWFGIIKSGTVAPFAWLRDPAFAALSYVVSRAGLSYSVVAFIYSLLALAATIVFAASVVAQRWATLFFYLLFCLYFTVGEMTEIRVAVAQPLMAWSLYLACEGHRLKAILVFIVSLVFHFSAIAALPFLIFIIVGVKFRSRIWIYSLVPLGILAAVGMNRLIELLQGVYRVSEFLNGGAEENDLRVISWYALAHLLVIAASVLLLWKTLSLHQRMAALLCSLGLSLFIVFGSNTGLATRFLNLFDFYWLLLMVVVLEKIKGDKRLLYIAFLMVAGFALYVKSLQFVEPYSIEIAM